MSTNHVPAPDAMARIKALAATLRRPTDAELANFQPDPRLADPKSKVARARAAMMVDNRNAWRASEMTDAERRRLIRAGIAEQARDAFTTTGRRSVRARAPRRVTAGCTARAPRPRTARRISGRRATAPPSDGDGPPSSEPPPVITPDVAALLIITRGGTVIEDVDADGNVRYYALVRRPGGAS